jgi:hypothetical protein
MTMKFKPDSLAVNKAASNSEIVYRDLVVMGVSEMDALWFAISPKISSLLSIVIRN